MVGYISFYDLKWPMARFRYQIC